MARPINRERFSAAVAALRAEPMQSRLVDVLLPLRAEFEALQGEGRTMVELWRVVNQADVQCTYPNFVRALKEVLERRVTPLAAARARKRAGRRKAVSLPVVPQSVRTEPAPTPAAASTGPMFGDPFQRAATESVAAMLVQTFKPKPNPSTK